MALDLQVWSRDANRVRKGVLPVLTCSAVFRESDVGTWLMTLDGNDARAALAQKGTGVIITEGDKVLMSGPILGIATESQDGIDTVVINGISDMHIFADRLVYPDPTRGFDQQTGTGSVANYVRTGVAETLIVNMVNEQHGPTSTFSVRRTPGLPLLVTQGRGPSTSVNSRWQTMLSEIRTLCTVGNLVIDVIHETGTTFSVPIRVPVDRSRSIRFMEDSGLGNYTVKQEAETSTTVIVGGSGEGTARKIYGLSRPNADTWFNGGRRIEVFVDRRDTVDTVELRKSVDETWAETAQQQSATLDVTETAQFRFGTHYQLGDKVAVVLPGGGEIVDRVRAAEVEWDEHGRSVKLTVGAFSTESEIDTESNRAQIRAMQKSIRKQEVQ